MFCIYCQGNKTSTTSPKTKLLHLVEQRFTREKKNLLVFSRYSWILALTCGEQLLWCIETLTSTFYFALSCARPCLAPALQCSAYVWIAASMQTAVEPASSKQIPKLGQNNIKLKNKYDSMIFFSQKQIHKMLLPAAAQGGFRTQKHTMA